VTANRNKKMSSNGYHKKNPDQPLPTTSESPVPVSVLSDDESSLFSEDEVRAMEAMRQAKKSDIDLSAFISPMQWSAEGLLIRAAEGLKKSEKLKTYIPDFKGGHYFDLLVKEGDRCAQRLRGDI
jgi:hypothetical protein